jgi:hypothetical protein
VRAARAAVLAGKGLIGFATIATASFATPAAIGFDKAGHVPPEPDFQLPKPGSINEPLKI